MKFGLLSKYFPPPQFLKPPHIGISFSDSNIKAVSIKCTSSVPDLKTVIMPVEKGAIVDGKIINMKEVVEKLTSLRKDFDLPFVFFAVPDELTYVFSASIPIGKGSNAEESVAFVIEENVPLSLSDTVFDFVPTNINLSEQELTASVVVAACVKKEVEKFIEALRSSGFEPVGCIHESQAIAGALIPKNSLGTLCIVHARENRVGIYSIKDNLVLFSTLRSVMSGDYGRQFLDEYEKFLEYCSKYDANKNQQIKSVLVCGEFEYAKKVVETIIDSANNTKDVKLSNVWANVFEIDKHQPDVPYEKSLSFAGPIGAVLSEII
jgi:hypothetical protein